MLYSGIVLWTGSEWFSGCSEHTWERFQQCGRSVKEKEVIYELKICQIGTISIDRDKKNSSHLFLYRNVSGYDSFYSNDLNKI